MKSDHNHDLKDKSLRNKQERSLIKLFSKLTVGDNGDNGTLDCHKKRSIAVELGMYYTMNEELMLRHLVLIL